MVPLVLRPQKCEIDQKIDTDSMIGRISFKNIVACTSIVAICQKIK